MTLVPAPNSLSIEKLAPGASTRRLVSGRPSPAPATAAESAVDLAEGGQRLREDHPWRCRSRCPPPQPGWLLAHPGVSAHRPSPAANLIPLVTQVEQRLAQLAFIAEQVRQVVVHLGVALPTAPLGARRRAPRWHKSGSPSTTSSTQLDLLRPRLRQIEDVVDQLQEMSAAPADIIDIVAIALVGDRPEGLAQHDLGETDDRVQRRAQLVAHHGQELRLGAARALGLLLGEA